MAQSTFGSPYKAVEGETKALTTTAGYVAVKPGFHEVKFYCPVQWRLALSPKLLHAVTPDGNDYVQSVTDRSSSTHMPLDAITSAQYFYLGFSEPALGVYFDLHATNVNAVAATLDVEYCSTALSAANAVAFTDVAGDSDGTDSGGATLAQDGVYTWTLPTAWKKSLLGTWAARERSDCWWIRMKPSATLSATIDVEEIIPVYKNVNYGYYEGGVEYFFAINEAQVGGFVVLSSASTPTLDITWIKH